MAEEEVKYWLKHILIQNNLDNYEVIFDNAGTKDEGYMSSIIIVNLKNLTDTENTTDFNLLIKKGSPIKEVRKAMVLDEAFSNEILMYGTLFPLYREFQLNKGITDLFESYPKCYGYKYFENFEIIVLENMKKTGYRLYDRKKNMDLQHCRIILAEYAKLHALSFAFKDQDPETFNNVSKKLNNIFYQFLNGNKNWKILLEDNFKSIHESLIEHGDTELLERYKKEMENPYELSLNLFNNVDDQSVFVHGDNWNNNYLIEYKDNQEIPTGLAIIDWQASYLHSPIYDISSFLYNVSSKKELDHIADLLKFYHAKFSEFLTKLGSDPEKLFNYTDMKKHWRKYSLYGLVGNAMNIKLAVLDKDQAPSTDQLGKGKTVDELFNVETSGSELYYRRVKDAIESYFLVKENVCFLD